MDLRGNWPTVLNAFIAGGFGALGAKGFITPEVAVAIVTVLAPVVTRLAHGMEPPGKAASLRPAPPPPPPTPVA